MRGAEKATADVPLPSSWPCQAPAPSSTRPCGTQRRPRARGQGLNRCVGVQGRRPLLSTRPPRGLHAIAGLRVGGHAAPPPARRAY